MSSSSQNAVVSGRTTEVSDSDTFIAAKTINLGVKQAARKRWGSLTFLLMVLIPGLLVSFYYAFFASDQYFSEVRFVVRSIGISAEIGAESDTPSLLSQSLSQDGHIAASFVESVELVERLEAKIGLRKKFSDPKIDYFSRLKPDATLEELFDFWQYQVSTYVDGPSGIIVFTIRAFSPEDALEIANFTLAETTELVDLISERAKQDLVKRSEQEVIKASQNYQKALDDLMNYQNETGILDPFSNAEILGRLLSELIAQRLQTEAQLNVLIANGVQSSPRKTQLENLLASLDDQIKTQKNSLAGADVQDDQLSSALVGFSKLATTRLVAEAIYQSAREIMDLSKSAALRRTTYVSVFSPAKLAQKAEYPKRYAATLMAVIALFVVWGSFMLLWASIEDHRR